MSERAAVVDAVEASEGELQGLLRDLIGFRTESQAKEATHFPDEARRCIAYVGDFLSGSGSSSTAGTSARRRRSPRTR